jgi:hypothetical protein
MKDYRQGGYVIEKKNIVVPLIRRGEFLVNKDLSKN